MVSRRAISRRGKVSVTKSTAAPPCDQVTIFIGREIMQKLATLCVENLSSHWYMNSQIGPGTSGTIRALTVQTTISDMTGVVAQMEQSVQRFVSFEKYISATTAVAS